MWHDLKRLLLVVDQVLGVLEHVQKVHPPVALQHVLELAVRAEVAWVEAMNTTGSVPRRKGLEDFGHALDVERSQSSHEHAYH
jgi:hypothetical protein